MLTATKDLMLPATVTGSWPRPRWYDGGLWGRPLDTALLDVRFREQFLDAHSTVIADQERAGLDILTNGDYHLDEDFAGRSWHHYPLQRWKGFEHEELQYEGSRDSLLAFPAGTLMNEIETTWRWPRVVGKVEHNPKNPLEYAKLWRIAQARAASGKPVKFGTCSSQVLAIFLDSHTDQYDLDDKKQLIWDMAGAMNLELRQLAAAGAKVIQIEEPTIHFTAAFHPEETELLDFMVDAFNHEVDGLDDVELWIHTCWGNPNMQKVYSGESYANSIDTYLNRLKGDVWTVEATENDLAEIDLFKPYASNLKKKVAVGVVNHRTLQADMAPVVAGRIRRALEVIPADKLILSSDCGFGRQGFNRTVAFYKATGIAQGRNIVLKELGLEERYVRGRRSRAAARRAAGPGAADAPAVALEVARRPAVDHDDAMRMLKAIATAFDEHDLDGIMANFADDAVFESPRGPEAWARGSSAQRRSARPSPRGSPGSPTSGTSTTTTSWTATAGRPSGRCPARRPTARGSRSAAATCGRISRWQGREEGLVLEDPHRRLATDADEDHEASAHDRPGERGELGRPQAVLGTRGDPHRCQCQRYRMQFRESWNSVGVEELGFRLLTQTHCGQPDAGTTSGLVAYLDGEPVGWCAVAPRADHARLLRDMRVPWVGRMEDKSDPGVWAVTCFVTRAGSGGEG